MTIREYTEGLDAVIQVGITGGGLSLHLSTDVSYTFDCTDTHADLDDNECTATNYASVALAGTTDVCDCKVRITFQDADPDRVVVWSALGAGDNPQETVAFAWISAWDGGQSRAWIYLEVDDVELNGCDFAITLPEYLICFSAGEPSEEGCECEV